MPMDWRLLCGGRQLNVILDRTLKGMDMRTIASRWAPSLVLIAATVVLSASPVAAAELPALTGQVVDSSQGVLPGTTVTVVPKEQPAAEPLVQVSDADGKFQFEGLAPGSYTVTFSMPGFDEQRL